MSCNYPGRGIQAPSGALTYYGHLQISAGKLPTSLPANYRAFPLPCGKCAGCKLERSRQWAVRLMHEAQRHERTSFITLTYNDNALPRGAAASQSLSAAPLPGLPLTLDRRTRAETHTYENQDKNAATLSKRHLKEFTWRLNSHCQREFGKGVRYFACGEYGERTFRPHYHIAVYGEDFGADRAFWKNAQSGNPLYRSKTLARLWPHGDADIGELTYESAAYVARYIMKKITGTKAHEHYKRVNEEGEYWLTPEFVVMSRRPGIGKAWFDQHKDDVYPHDHVISRGHPAKPPRYYDNLLEKLDPYLLADIKTRRETEGQKHAEDHTNARLEARETVLLAKLNQTKRSLE